MKHPIDHRILAAFLSSGMLIALSGCERALEVVDQLEGSGPGSEGTGSPGQPVSPPVQNASCACASSASLMALSCGGGEVPLLDNDIVQTTANGAIVVFNRCNEETFSCDVMYWDGGNPTPIAPGYLIGIDASGQRLLVSGATTSLVEVGGSTTELPLYTLQGRGLLNAAGDRVFGGVFEGLEQGTRLVRADAAGELEVLGDLEGSIATSSGNPAGTALVGWSLVDDGAADAEISYRAFRWGADGLRLDFPGVPAGVTIWPESVSADGSIIAGRSLPGQAHFVWSEAGGYTELASASWRSETSLSADGAVALGSLDPEGENDSAAFRWTAETGAVELTPGRASLALDLSSDGDVAVAYSWEEAQFDGVPPEDTFVWDVADGTRTLDQVLEQRGVDTSGWEFGTPRALSGDGRVLLGRASCGGVPTLYRVVLSD